MEKKGAYHGGAFFDKIGKKFVNLERSQDVIGADVLDAWFNPSPRALDKIREHLAFTIRTSPPAQCEGLIETIASVRNISKDCIAVAGGSSDVMFNIFTHIVNPESTILILDPMYGEYAHIFEHIAVPKNLYRHLLTKKDNFVIDKQLLMKDIVAKQPSIIVLVNPNSPTGKFLGSEYIIELCEQFPDTLFVVDETYIDYVDVSQSIEKDATRLPNLIVIKSMSKVYALSGARIGYMVSSQERIMQLRTFFPPWSVGLIGQIAGVEALQDPEYYMQCYKTTHLERERMSMELKKMKNIKIYDSVANFLLVELLGNISAVNLIQRLQEKDIYIRNCDSMSTQFKDNFIRIAVKSSDQNQKIIHEIRKILELTKSTT